MVKLYDDVWCGRVRYAFSSRLRVTCTTSAERLEFWLCYMMVFGVVGCDRPCLVGLVLEVRFRLIC